jgi:hypothetical protein
MLQPFKDVAAVAEKGGIPLYFHPAKPSANIYLVTVDGDCDGGAEAELVFDLWLNTVLIPGELAAPGYNRAWSLHTVMPLTKCVPEAGDRGKFLTVYEVQTDDIEKVLAARSTRIDAAIKAAPQPFGPIVKGMKERQVVAYRVTTSVLTRANTVPAPYANKATPPVPEPPPGPGTKRFLLAVETNLKDKSQAPVFNAWYNEVHIPDVLTSPGYRGVVRLQRVTDAPDRGVAMTFYEIHTDDFAKAIATRDQRRLRELVFGAYSGGAVYMGTWAQAYYEPMGEVIVSTPAR